MRYGRGGRFRSESGIQTWIPQGLLTAVLVFVATNVVFPARLTDHPVWKDSTGNPVSFASLEQFEEFLQTAVVVKSNRVPEGTTAPRKVLLEKEGLRMWACFRFVKVNKPQIRLASGRIAFNFRDDAIFEVAAYQLGKLLGFNNIPPTVVRTIHGQSGTLQAWVPDCMMEKDRSARKVQAPSAWRWAMELQAVRLFDGLIYNEDRNVGNLLLDADWSIWMIDHTRSFRKFDSVAEIASIQVVERGVWKSLNQVSDGIIRARLSDYLEESQITTLLKRRALIVDHLRGRIAETGESQVLYLLPVEPGRGTTTAAIAFH